MKKILGIILVILIIVLFFVMINNREVLLSTETNVEWESWASEFFEYAGCCDPCTSKDNCKFKKSQDFTVFTEGDIRGLSTEALNVYEEMFNFLNNTDCPANGNPETCTGKAQALNVSIIVEPKNKNGQCEEGHPESEIVVIEEEGTGRNCAKAKENAIKKIAGKINDEYDEFWDRCDEYGRCVPYVEASLVSYDEEISNGQCTVRGKIVMEMTCGGGKLGIGNLGRGWIEGKACYCCVEPEPAEKEEI